MAPPVFNVLLTMTHFAWAAHLYGTNCSSTRPNRAYRRLSDAHFRSIVNSALSDVSRQMLTMRGHFRRARTTRAPIRAARTALSIMTWGASVCVYSSALSLYVSRHCGRCRGCLQPLPAAYFCYSGKCRFATVGERLDVSSAPLCMTL